MKAELNKEELIEIADSLLQEGRAVTFRMQGYSMYPTMKPGDVGLVERCSSHDLKIGDIVVFRSSQKLIAHRLVKIISQNNIRYYIARGDHNRCVDVPFVDQALIGKVVSFERNGRTRKADHSGLKIKSVFPRLFPRVARPYYSLIILFRHLLTRVATGNLSIKRRYK